jgi:hypothetical protein
VVTSDIVKLPKSPLNFSEKKSIMVQQDIPADKIIEENNPYKPTNFLKQFDQATTAVVYIIGQKDMVGEDGKAPRFKVTDNNNYETNKGAMRPLQEGQSAYYVYVAPHVISSVSVSDEKGKKQNIKFDSGTQIRKLIAQGDKNIFKAILGVYNKNLYNFLVNKFRESEAYVEPEGKKNKKSVTETYIHGMIEQLLTEHIRKKGNKYCLLSKKENKNLGCYKTKSAAKERERQVQYFKRLKEMSTAASVVGYVVKNIDKKEEN